jgi:hypothetical protein
MDWSYCCRCSASDSTSYASLHLRKASVVVTCSQNNRHNTMKLSGPEPGHMEKFTAAVGVVMP